MNVFFLIVFCLLCGMTNLKVADVQLFEFAIIATLPFILLKYGFSAFVVDSDKQTKNFVFAIFIFLLFALFGSILSLRLNFYPPPGAGFLKSPPFASFIRLFQVMLNLFVVFFIVRLIGRDRKALIIACRTYVYAGLLSALWGIVSYIGWQSGVQLEGAYAIESVRMRGFFVEGGPLGLFIVSALMVNGFRIYHLQDKAFGLYRAEFFILWVALLGSQSKAAVLLLMIVVLFWLYNTKKLGISFYSVIALLPIMASSDLYERLNSYADNRLNFYTQAWERPDDVNLIMGRVMGSVLVPRMVEQHPLIGIGIGNYALIRNDPKVLKGLPANDGWDLHGLGILGYFAELGIPLTLLAIWIYAYPFRMTTNLPTWIRALALFPLLAALFGVQLNFAYPWVLGGIALAARRIPARPPVPPKPVARPMRRPTPYLRRGLR